MKLILNLLDGEELYFSVSFVEGMIYFAIALTTFAFIFLMRLLIKDIKGKTLW